MILGVNANFSNYRIPAFGKSIKNDESNNNNPQPDNNSLSNDKAVPLKKDIIDGAMMLFLSESGFFDKFFANGNYTDEQREYAVNYVKAKLKVLGNYRMNMKLQQNEVIGRHIKKIAGGVNNDEEAEAVLDILNNNSDNKDEEYFKKLENLLRYHIDPALIKKVMNNQSLYKNVSDSMLTALKKIPSDKLTDTFDDYLDNYSNSEFVTQELDYILELSYKYGTNNPREYARKLMREFSEEDTLYKDESADDFCERIEEELADIEMGRHWSKPKDLNDIKTELKPASSDIFISPRSIIFNRNFDLYYNKSEAMLASCINDHYGIANISNDIIELKNLLKKIQYKYRKYNEPDEKEKIKNTLEIVAACLDERNYQGFQYTKEAINRDIKTMYTAIEMLK